MKANAKKVKTKAGADKTNTLNLKGEPKKNTESIEKLESQYKKVSSELSKTQNSLFVEKERRLLAEAQVLDLNRLKEMSDTKSALDSVRAEIVENQLSRQVKDLEVKLKYYEQAPFKAGLKKAAFSILRLIRHVLPLPETLKVNIARKLTKLAVALKPPAHFSHLPQVEAFSDTTHIDFEFQQTDKPIISVVVPVFNEISQTIACLRSISQQNVSVSYEVILADDKSSDPFHSILKDIPGLRYFRNEENLHFLRNCNKNAKHARGEYIAFLNNDTIVKPGWLQNLYQTFFESEDVGVVGSKLIYPNGDLQESGGIMWEDASGWNWGKGQSADHPLYNFLRDADYVSGASLMITSKLWKEIGGFSEKYEKAYYEDTDLCFRVRSLGYRVLYQPFSEVIHIEGLSSGNDVTQGVKQYQIINQQTFRETWGDTLGWHLPNATTPYLASDRHVRGHILYIDAVTPEPDKDSGSVDAYYSMKLLIEQGFRVHFLPVSNFAYWNEATESLQRMGVECIYHPFYSDLKSYLEERGDIFEYVIASRAECAAHFSTVRKYCPTAKTVYNTVDLHFLRLRREAQLLNDQEIALSAKRMERKEVNYIKDADATIVLSEVEYNLLSKRKALKNKLWTIPLIRPVSLRLVEYNQSKDIVFIGGYRHPPNVDAVEWLVNDIWPEIRKNLPGVKLHICGSHMPDHFMNMASDDIILKGFIPDLDALLSETRLTVAPLRFGAGLKGKVASSIGAGVPCVGTGTAFEGMSEAGLEHIKFEASTPKNFATLVSELYTNEEKWTEASLAGVQYHNENYSYREVSKTFMKMLESLK